MKKHVALVFLHHDYQLFLVQLRDFRPDIDYPGHWGGFGGRVESGETPLYASYREIEEELEWRPDNMRSFKQYDRFNGLVIHVFFAELSVPASELVLNEGLEMGLFSAGSILSGKLYSERFDRYFPVANPLPCILTDFLAFVGMPEAIPGGVSHDQNHSL